MASPAGMKYSPKAQVREFGVPPIHDVSQIKPLMTADEILHLDLEVEVAMEGITCRHADGA